MGRFWPLWVSSPPFPLLFPSLPLVEEMLGPLLRESLRTGDPNLDWEIAG